MITFGVLSPLYLKESIELKCLNMLKILPSLSPKEKLKLVATMLLTDGSVYLTPKYGYPKIKYYGKDKVLHDIFVELVQSTYHTTPSTIYSYNMETYFGRKEHLNIYRDLIELSPSYDKLSNVATIGFLRASPPVIRETALRLAMSAEGSICISRKRKGTIRGVLSFACANENLCGEWVKLFKKCEINMGIQRDLQVSTKLHGLQTVSQKDIITFCKIGGFIPNVRIHRGRRFRGFEKNAVLNAFCEFVKMVKSKELKEYSKLENNKFWWILNNLVQGTPSGARG